MNNIKMGSRGEDLAARFLQQQGYQIRERNFTTLFGEIDIIAQDGDSLVFIEVKMRKSSNQRFLAAAVNERKQKKIVRVAEYYLYRKIRRRLPGRFDVIFVMGTRGREQIRHIKGAFQG